MAIEKGSKKVRYAVVGLGWIAQEVVLPAFTKLKNSELVALVTSDPTKASELGDKYKVSKRLGYADYNDFVRSGDVDAVYIALPNNLHREYTARAAHAGVHVLCEKPMADTSAECLEMIRAAEQNDIRLMIAYRLHFEPGNLKAIETVMNGTIGEPRIFSSVLSEQVAAGNVRLNPQEGGGPLLDMGVYQINAARYLFRDEPIEVFAFGTHGSDPRFTEVYEMVSGTLRFPGDRFAAFTCSFGAATVNAYSVVGTKGEMTMDPGYDFHPQLKLKVKGGEKESVTEIPKVDQFGGEIEYFSDCILNSKEPEPSGYEGLADLRVVEALTESIKSGRPVTLEPFEKKTRPDKSQERKRPPFPPEKKLVHAKAATAS